MTDPAGDKFDVWPLEELEQVACCPVCQSSQRTLRHEAVKDWTFESAPGLWNYWLCHDCACLYLHPRPTASSIGRAYTSYYTHRPAPATGGVRGLKLRWKNERLSLRLDRSIHPRLDLPRWLRTWAMRKAQRMTLSFGIDALTAIPVGRFMDVGCGSGAVVALAHQMGWQAEGLELDRAAVAAAHHAGLAVAEGGYERLFERPLSFDVVLCSHVIEHVHDPIDLLKAIHAALRPGGVLLLSTPNVKSDVHGRFGRYWRGLEAPRHLTLFDESSLSSLMRQVGFEVASHADQLLETVKASQKIEALVAAKDPHAEHPANLLSQEITRSQGGHDFIKLSGRKC